MCLMTIYESSLVKYLLNSFEKKFIACFFFGQDFFINLEYICTLKHFLFVSVNIQVCVCVCVCVFRTSLYSLKTFFKMLSVYMCAHIFACGNVYEFGG